MTTRERLGKMGLSALLSYGFVSNMSYAVSVSLAWYGFSKRVSQSVMHACMHVLCFIRCVCVCVCVPVCFRGGGGERLSFPS
jgi:hypothetical protein